MHDVRLGSGFLSSGDLEDAGSSVAHGESLGFEESWADFALLGWQECGKAAS